VAEPRGIEWSGLDDCYRIVNKIVTLNAANATSDAGREGRTAGRRHETVTPPSIEPAVPRQPRAV